MRSNSRGQTATLIRTALYYYIAVLSITTRVLQDTDDETKY